MDGKGFDRFAIVVATAASRRKLVGRAAGGVVGALSFHLAGGRARAAAHRAIAPSSLAGDDGPALVGDDNNDDCCPEERVCGDGCCPADQTCFSGRCGQCALVGHECSDTSPCCPEENVVCANAGANIHAISICRDMRNIPFYMDPLNCGWCRHVCKRGPDDGEACIGTRNPAPGKECDEPHDPPEADESDARCVKCPDFLKYCKRDDEAAGTCRNLAVDAESCGECFNECAPGQQCVGGVCTS